jgi:hypothetical protein
VSRAFAGFWAVSIGILAGTSLGGSPATPIGAQCIDGELASMTPDSSIWRKSISDSSAIQRPQVVTLSDGDVFLNNRRLRCYGETVAQRRSDSSILIRSPLNIDLDPTDTSRALHRLEPKPSRIPWFSFGAGISLEAALKTRGNLPDLINRSVDSVDADVANERLSPTFEMSLFRFVGFQYSPGLFGGFRLRGTKNDLVDISYHESRTGLFIELYPRHLNPRFPESNFRVSYHWLSGQLELGTDTLRSHMISYQGPERVVIEVEGNAWEYALEVGSAPFARFFLLDRQLQYGSKELTHGFSMGLVCGFRI